MGAKEKALANRKPEDKVLYTDRFKDYAFCKSYNELLEIIKGRKVPRISEYIFENLPVNFFYDIDIKEKDNLEEFNNYKTIVKDVIEKTVNFFTERRLHAKVIALSSHTTEENVTSSGHKKSFHITFRIVGVVFTIPCCISIANFIFSGTNYMQKGIIDKSVLREGNLRAILCSKPGENRPLVRSKLYGDQDFNDVETFVQYYSDDAIIWTEKELSIPVNHERGTVAVGEKRKVECKGSSTKAKKVQITASPSSSSLPSSSLPQTSSHAASTDLDVLYKFILEKYDFSPSDLSSCTRKDSGYFFNITSTKYCHSKGADHKSNGQFIYVNPVESARMCHDKVDCGNSKHNCVLSKDYPDDLRALFSSETIMKEAKEDCKGIVKQEYDYKPIEEVCYDNKVNMFSTPAAVNLLQTVFTRGRCPNNCKIEHQVFQKGHHIKCSMCNVTFPNSGLISWDQTSFPNLHKYFINIVQNNNTTTNTINVVNNNYNSAEDEFGCEVFIDVNIFKDQKFTDIVNQILDGHKICDIARLMKKKYDLFTYDRSMNEWYYFNGFRWKKDGGSLDFKEKIIKARIVFNDILLFYKDQPVTENLTHLRKNVKSLIKKMSDPGLKGLILEEAKNCFREEDFCLKLNSKTSLVPFTNGVYDLLTGEFRTEVTKEDYVELTMGYDYDPHVNNPAVHDFLLSVLPDKSVRDYMLKMLSICLNGGISNEKFIFLVGVGSNGKSQLMNLMSQTMGQFNGKANGKMFTGKKPDYDAPTPSLMGLKDKRFASASETEEGERINLALLKEITGDEYKVQGRNLNENITQFKMQAKFFLSTNTLPEIPSEGPSIWRRIRVVDFPTNFVDSPNPLKQNEKKKDPVIPSRIDNDVTWRQTFFNILLSYYDQDIPEPHAVLVRTEEYREESNEVEQWVKENIEFKAEGILELTDLNIRRFGPDYKNKQTKGKFKKEVEKVLRQLGESVEGFDHRIKNTGGSKKWKGVTFRKSTFHTEIKLENWFLLNNIKIFREMSFPWTLNEATGHHRRYDFYIPDHNILVELDGAQHFEEVEKWGKLNDVKENDDIKNKLALQHHYHVVRICQRIVLRDGENWEVNLKNTIHELRNEKRARLVKIGSVYGGDFL